MFLEDSFDQRMGEKFIMEDSQDDTAISLNTTNGGNAGKHQNVPTPKNQKPPLNSK
jgi:hypothetical protein